MKKVQVSDAFYEKLYELRFYLHELAVCRIMEERLDDLGVPDGSVIFSTYSKTHTCKDGSVSEYTYTNSYIYICGVKYYITRKDDRRGRLGNVNNPNNKRSNLVLRGRIALRMKIKALAKNYLENARLVCGILNASRPRGVVWIDLEKAMGAEYIALFNSDQYMPIRIRTDNELACADAESMSGGRPDFTNAIFLCDGERMRSKNELIAALCMREAGFSYGAEPRYPGCANYFADFRLALGENKNVYIEIAGMMNEPEYKERIYMKRDAAVARGVPLVIIDMTDYPDENGRRSTCLRYDKLKKIFFDIQLGRLPCKGEIVRAY